jgi:hypothetical protein
MFWAWNMTSASSINSVARPELPRAHSISPMTCNVVEIAI